VLPMQRKPCKTSDLLLVTVYFIHIEDTGSCPTVFLKDTSSYRVLPISIGTHENNVIIQLSKGEDLKSKRPSTYTLFSSILRENKIAIDSVVIDTVENGIFCSYVNFANGKAIDARPSDSIALALACEKPILVNSEVMDVYSVRVHISGDLYKYQKKEISDFIKHMRPDDFC
jgi:bifunctional DNase/RNase